MGEWYKRCFGHVKCTKKFENKEDAVEFEKENVAKPEEKESSTNFENEEEIQQITSSPDRYSTPPPVLTPEPPTQEDTPEDTVAIVETPLKAPPSRRKIGFMIEDLLKPSPKRQLKCWLAKGRKVEMTNEAQ